MLSCFAFVEVKPRCVCCPDRKEQHTTFSFQTSLVLKAFIVSLRRWASLLIHSSSSLRCFCLKNSGDGSLNSRLLQRYFPLIGLSISCLMGFASVLCCRSLCLGGRGGDNGPHPRSHSVTASCMYYSVVCTFSLWTFDAVTPCRVQQIMSTRINRKTIPDHSICSWLQNNCGCS